MHHQSFVKPFVSSSSSSAATLLRASSSTFESQLRTQLDHVKLSRAPPPPLSSPIAVDASGMSRRRWISPAIGGEAYSITSPTTVRDVDGDDDDYHDDGQEKAIDGGLEEQRQQGDQDYRMQQRQQQQQEMTTKQMAQVGVLIATWYALNIYFNLFNKQVLKVYPFPFTVSTFQFAISAVFVTFMWGFSLYRKPKVTNTQILSILPLAILHTLGNFFSNVSLGKVAVSFTHTIKAMEPFFTVTLSSLFLGEVPSPLVLASLVPIVGGVALASVTEVSFDWIGFWSAMASNLVNQTRNVISKGLMVDSAEEEALDDINLFSIITVMSFFLSVPVTLFAEGVKFTPSFIQQAGLNVNEIYIRSLLAAVCFHGYQQVSYMILGRMSPITHSVANSVKRVVVIVSAVLFFQTPVTLINALGTAIALVGVFFYSRAKKIKQQ